MSLTTITPEGWDVANAYLLHGSIDEVNKATGIPVQIIAQTLERAEVKRYIDAAYLDMGYRNRNKLGSLLDKMIDAKVQEAEESGIYTSKDLLELLTLAHKMRMDEIKAEKGENGTVVNVAQFGGDKYGKLMEKLIG